MQETRGTCTGLQQAHQQQHLHSQPANGHLQQEGSDQGLCGCSCCTNHLRCRHHLLACGSNKQVIMLRSEGWEFLRGALEGLEVPLGALEGLGVLLGLWLQNSLCQKS